jgi:hypothetical protein
MSAKFWAAIGTALFLAFGIAWDGHTASVDPKVVGAWEIFVPNSLGQTRWVGEIRGGGTYTLYVPANGHSGTFEAEAGHWSLVSKTTVWKDQGTYDVSNPVVFVVTGILGSGRWKRVTQAPFFNTIKVGNQHIPANVPQIVADMLKKKARPWHSDAIAVALEMERTRYEAFYAKMSFVSPSTGSGLDVEVLPFGVTTRAIPSVNWGTMALPKNFVDLPKVVEIARQNGGSGEITRASLSFNVNWGWVWGVISEREVTSSSIQAETGQVLMRPKGGFKGFVPPKDRPGAGFVPPSWGR